MRQQATGNGQQATGQGSGNVGAVTGRPPFRTLVGDGSPVPQSPAA